MIMSREEIYRDMEDTLGIVPSFFKALPDSSIEQDWNTFKAIEMKDGLLDAKTKSLIGLGVAAAIKCHYCTYYHTQAAKMSGATDAEIAEALRYTMDTTGWSTFLNGLDLDFEQFKKELNQMREYVAKRQEEKEPVRAAF
jgi:AhpD family alkylhydroperoxidase